MSDGGTAGLVIPWSSTFVPEKKGRSRASLLPCFLPLRRSTEKGLTLHLTLALIRLTAPWAQPVPNVTSAKCDQGPGMASHSVQGFWWQFQIQNYSSRSAPSTGASSLPFSCRVGGVIFALRQPHLQLPQITAVALCVCVFFLFRCPFFFFPLMRVKERTRRNGSHLSEDNGPKAIDVMAPSSE